MKKENIHIKINFNDYTATYQKFASRLSQYFSNKTIVDNRLTIRKGFYRSYEASKNRWKRSIVDKFQDVEYAITIEFNQVTNTRQHAEPGIVNTITLIDRLSERRLKKRIADEIVRACSLPKSIYDVDGTEKLLDWGELLFHRDYGYRDLQKGFMFDLSDSAKSNQALLDDAEMRLRIREKTHLRYLDDLTKKYNRDVKILEDEISHIKNNLKNSTKHCSDS
jgi:hypothetical protein